VRYPHPYNSSLQGARANRANGGNMKIEKYLNKLKEAEDYFANEYGYEIVIYDKDLLRKVFSIVEKIRKKITLKYYNSVIVEISFDLGREDALLIKIVRKCKSLIFYRFITQNLSNEENKISVFISFTRDNIYERRFLDKDIEMIRGILKSYKIKDYKQLSTPYSETIRFSIPLEGKVIKYII
jgi:hypothetical protein